MKTTQTLVIDVNANKPLRRWCVAAAIQFISIVAFISCSQFPIGFHFFFDTMPQNQITVVKSDGKDPDIHVWLLVWSSLAHFRDNLSLTIKARPDAQPFIWNEFTLPVNEISFSFDSEAKVNSEMAYSHR